MGILFLILLPEISWSMETIKIAILDNLRSEKLSSVIYENDYLSGVDTAFLAAKSQGINIDYKYFKYERGKLDILTKLTELKAWKPDYIIGPRSSDSFLLLKPYFNDIMIVSPLASANAVADLPSNFYSFILPDPYISRVIEKFIQKNYPQTNHIYIVSAADCKSCYDIGKNFFNIYQRSHSSIKVIYRTFLTENVDKINVTSLVPGLKVGDIVITPNVSYISGVLIARIVNHFKIPNLVFIGADGWSTAEVGYVGKMPTDVPFLAYRLSQWSLDSNTRKVNHFEKLYYEKFGKIPRNTISYATFNAVMSAVTAYASAKKNGTPKEKILSDFYQTAPQFCSKQFAIYKFEKDQKSEKLIDIIYF